jgi:hypothetical protein
MILDKEANGEWLQALALALDYYENYVQVLEDRLRQQDWDVSPTQFKNSLDRTFDSASFLC